MFVTLTLRHADSEIPAVSPTTKGEWLIWTFLWRLKTSILHIMISYQDGSPPLGGPAPLSHGEAGHGDADSQVSQHHRGHWDWAARNSHQVRHHQTPDTLPLQSILHFSYGWFIPRDIELSSNYASSHWTALKNQDSVKIFSQPEMNLKWLMGLVDKSINYRYEEKVY